MIIIPFLTKLQKKLGNFSIELDPLGFLLPRPPTAPEGRSGSRQEQQKTRRRGWRRRRTKWSGEECWPSRPREGRQPRKCGQRRRRSASAWEEEGRPLSAMAEAGAHSPCPSRRKRKRRRRRWQVWRRHHRPRLRGECRRRNVRRR